MIGGPSRTRTCDQRIMRKNSRASQPPQCQRLIETIHVPFGKVCQDFHYCDDFGRSFSHKPPRSSCAPVPGSLLPNPLAKDPLGLPLLQWYLSSWRISIVPDRPSGLVGTRRHIRGAYSVLELAWDAAKSQLRGSSQTVAGDPYTLWVYVPEGVMLSQVRAATKRNPTVPVGHKLTRNSLEVTFKGHPEVVDWKKDFATKAAHWPRPQPGEGQVTKTRT